MPHDDTVLNTALARLFDVPHDEPRPDSTTVASLARQLHSLLANLGTMHRPLNEIEGLLYRELREVVGNLDANLVESGVPHAFRGETGKEPLQERADTFRAFIDGEGVEALSTERGTHANPYTVPPRGTVPLSEFTSDGYVD